MRSDLELKNKGDCLNGLYKEIAALSDVETARKIFEEDRGQQLTFPMEFYSKEYIYSRIVEEYNGSNIKYLATKYEYSERTIRRILNR